MKTKAEVVELMRPFCERPPWRPDGPSIGLWRVGSAIIQARTTPEGGVTSSFTSDGSLVVDTKNALAVLLLRAAMAQASEELSIGYLSQLDPRRFRPDASLASFATEEVLDAFLWGYSGVYSAKAEPTTPGGRLFGNHHPNMEAVLDIEVDALGRLASLAVAVPWCIASLNPAEMLTNPSRRRAIDPAGPMLRDLAATDDEYHRRLNKHAWMSMQVLAELAVGAVMLKHIAQAEALGITREELTIAGMPEAVLDNFEQVG